MIKSHENGMRMIKVWGTLAKSFQTQTLESNILGSAAQLPDL